MENSKAYHWVFNLRGNIQNHSRAFQVFMGGVKDLKTKMPRGMLIAITHVDGTPGSTVAVAGRLGSGFLSASDNPLHDTFSLSLDLGVVLERILTWRELFRRAPARRLQSIERNVGIRAIFSRRLRFQNGVG